VEFEGTLKKAALKECLWMENSEESLEGENDEASQQYVKRTEYETAIAQPCSSKLPLKTIKQ
jgi:hypothetical protein